MRGREAHIQHVSREQQITSIYLYVKYLRKCLNVSIGDVDQLRCVVAEDQLLPLLSHLLS